jgi:hypothetical protein
MPKSRTKKNAYPREPLYDDSYGVNINVKTNTIRLSGVHNDVYFNTFNKNKLVITKPMSININDDLK